MRRREEEDKAIRAQVEALQKRTHATFAAVDGITTTTARAILYNNGIDDIYMPQSRDLPNMLFLSQPDGSLKEVAANSGLNWLDETTVALFADFDNDGDQDLVVGTRERMAIHELGQNGLSLHEPKKCWL